ncbi:MAG: hypothetical protein KDJ96_11660 [Rhodobacteraceae bacterium]|nr:hypothetical protein [Paracoccaceae bacterium]
MTTGLFQGFARNAAGAARAFLPLRFDAAALEVTGAQLALCFAVNLLATLLWGLVVAWPVGSFEPWGVTSVLAGQAVMFLALALAVWIMGRGERFWPAVFVVLVGNTLFLIVTGALMRMTGLGIEDGIATVFSWALYVIVFIGLFRVLKGPGLRGGVRAGLAVGGYGIVSVLAAQFMPRAVLFHPQMPESTEAAYTRVDVERLYYAQPGLMADAVRALDANDPDRADLYAILGAGTSYEGVFLREATQIRDILKPMQGGAEGRTLILANSDAQPFENPMLGRRNLQEALNAVAGLADPDRDATLLYLTSHGGPESFSLGFYDAGLNNLGSEELSAMIDESGLTNLIIVVQACYSGSFVDNLAAPDRMVITAAAADRTSFGCASENLWTEFGRAYFDKALRDTGDFRLAFDRAREAIERREKDEGLTASNPQIAIGTKMGAFLDGFHPDQS